MDLQGARRTELQVEARSARQPVVNHGRPGRAVLVPNQADLQFLRDRLANHPHEFLELDHVVFEVALADHLAGGDVRDPNRGGCAVNLAVKSAPLRRAGADWTLRLVRSRAKPRDSSATHSPTASSGGRIQAHIFQLLLDAKQRAFGKLERLATVGLRPNFRQMRLTVAELSPSSATIDRVLHWVALRRGTDSSVRTTRCSSSPYFTCNSTRSVVARSANAVLEW